MVAAPSVHFRLYKRSIILQLITLAVIKVCSETPFNKKLCLIEVGQLIAKQSVRLYEFFWSDTSFHWQVFPNGNILLFEIILTRLNIFKWKALYGVEFYVNCYVHFNCFLLLTSFLGYWNFMFPIKVIYRLCWAQYQGRNWFETGGIKL